jgi:pilus assembly protein CpaC
LLIVVTPRIVQALKTKPVLPTDNYIQPTQEEFFLQGKLEGTAPPVNPVSTSIQVPTTTVPVAPVAVDATSVNMGNTNVK